LGNTVDLEKVRGWVDRAARVVVLTGAGISTESEFRISAARKACGR